jgi:hypothetical protein
LGVGRLGQLNRYVHDLGLALDAEREATFLEYFQHRDVIRQDLSDEFPETGPAGNRGEMMHERCAETLPLVLIDHGESDFCRSRPHNGVTRASRDHGPAAFLNDCDQCDVVDKVDREELLSH